MASRAESFPSAWATPQSAANRQAYDEQAALVRRAQAADQMAFHEIVERYQGKVFAIIHRMVRDRNDAEDIAQEVFANVFRSIGGYNCQGSILSWIYRIAVNECYEYLRRKKVRPLVYEADFAQEDGRALDTRSPAPRLDATLADRDYVLKLLACISEQERCLLLMREVEGYSVEEVSELTGINQNSVKVKLFRARQKLVKAAGRFRRPSRVGRE